LSVKLLPSMSTTPRKLQVYASRLVRKRIIAFTQRGRAARRTRAPLPIPEAAQHQRIPERIALRAAVVHDTRQELMAR
jgi:hypothetical protein